jgi:large subunit ribosomal protein L30
MAKKKTKKLKITQIRSGIDRPQRQRRTVRALGIRKMHQTVVHNDTPQIRGMIEKVAHLVSVEEVSE